MRKIDAGAVMSGSQFNRFHMMVFLWCFFAIGFDGYEIAMFGVSLPKLMSEWDLSSIVAGSIGSYGLIGMMIGALIFSPLADKIGRKKVLVICMFIFSAFTFVSGFLHTPLLFTCCRFIASLGMGGLMPNVISLMTEFSPKKKRAIIVAAMYCGYSFGGIAASLVGIYLMPKYDWRILYWLGGIPLIALPFFLKQFPESLNFYIAKKRTMKVAEILNRVDPDGNYQENEDYQVELTQSKIKGFPVRKLFEQKRTLSTISFWLAVFSCLLMVYGLNTWLPKIMQNIGFAAGSSLTFNVALYAGQIGGSLIGGYFADKIGHKRVLSSLYFLGIVCFLFLGNVSNVFWLYVFVTLGGACTVGVQNIANPYVSEYYPREIRATGIGWSLGIGRIGAILAPSLIGLLLSFQIEPQKAFMVFAVPSFVGALAIIMIQEKYSSFDQQKVDRQDSDQLEVELSQTEPVVRQ